MRRRPRPRPSRLPFNLNLEMTMSTTEEIRTGFNPTLRAKTCAAQLFGSWMIEPKWFAQAIEAVRSGKLKPAVASDDDDEEKEKPRG
jgi:methylphosphotriester-DNA--protein-cysteine methyltransferase